VSREAEVIRTARQVENDFSGVDVLVNNAGIARLGPSMDFSLDDWQASMDVMATGVFLCCREFGRHLRTRGGGSIVNISSINGLTAWPMRLAYSAAKAAVISMTKVLAAEWAGYGIRVNAVAPGVTNTELNRVGIESGLIDVDSYVRWTPLKRFAEPSEIADAVCYLASARAAFVTGHVLVPDGGWTAYGWIPWSGPEDSPARG
jgi:NAD(P)-dependent dehydrogenase (short-subunit alcohol dehydrogenase family)